MCPSENELYMLEVLSGASRKGFAAAAGVVEDSLAAQLPGKVRETGQVQSKDSTFPVTAYRDLDVDAVPRRVLNDTLCDASGFQQRLHNQHILRMASTLHPHHQRFLI
jgi:hypothetical protein